MGIGPKPDFGLVEGNDYDAGRRLPVRGQQSDAHACKDEVFDEIETVSFVAQPEIEACEGTDGRTKTSSAPACASPTPRSCPST
ncbi:hypothetical protein B0G38_003708 [Arthrobacter sp. VKM Ac-2550]|nr:hypothetical protein [Arthrobacter sp. VKM Ac-2550]